MRRAGLGFALGLWLVEAPRSSRLDAGADVPAMARVASQPAGECLVGPPAPGPGVVDPFHVPSAAAKQANADALGLYRQGRWEEARQKYLAAEATDPEFLAPSLNVACSFVREERFAEALAEVERLLDRAFLPWSDEVETAADLGALRVPPEGKRLRELLEDRRRKWADGLVADLLFVARTRAPLKVGTPDRRAASAFVLGPRQEVFAWSPRTRRYRQLTAEQGRVLVLGRSLDGRRMAYATAEKLILAPDAVPRLRGVVVKEIDLGTLAILAQTRVDRDIERLEILRAGPGFAYRIDSPAGKAGRAATFVIRAGGLDPAALPRTATVASSLTGEGASTEIGRVPLEPSCPGVARDVRSPGGVPAVQVQPKSGRPFVISGPFGGGIAGLPLQ